MIIAIDFDGTICQDNYPEIGIPQPYAVKYINALYDDGHYIIINTCRSGDLLLEAINWLTSKGIKFNRINDNWPGYVLKFGSNARKIHADIMIDDRNLGGFPGWPAAMDMIREMDISTDAQIARLHNHQK